jgi:hypothetical protein
VYITTIFKEPEQCQQWRFFFVGRVNWPYVSVHKYLNILTYVSNVSPVATSNAWSRDSENVRLINVYLTSRHCSVSLTPPQFGTVGVEIVGFCCRLTSETADFRGTALKTAAPDQPLSVSLRESFFFMSLYLFIPFISHAILPKIVAQWLSLLLSTLEISI